MCHKHVLKKSRRCLKRQKTEDISKTYWTHLKNVWWSRLGFETFWNPSSCYHFLVTEKPWIKSCTETKLKRSMLDFYTWYFLSINIYWASWFRLQKTTIKNALLLNRCVFKTSSSCIISKIPQNIFKACFQCIFFKMPSRRRLANTSWRYLGRPKSVTLKTTPRHIEDILTCLQHVVTKTNVCWVYPYP